jgi:hypothetical protein
LEGEYLPAALQGIPGVLCAVRLCQCLLQVKAFTCVCSWHTDSFVFWIWHYWISSVCRYTLTSRQRDLFERIALYCDHFTNTNFIPVSFVLGKPIQVS